MEISTYSFSSETHSVINSCHNAITSLTGWEKSTWFHKTIFLLHYLSFYSKYVLLCVLGKIFWFFLNLLNHYKKATTELLFLPKYCSLQSWKRTLPSFSLKTRTLLSLNNFMIFFSLESHSLITQYNNENWEHSIETTAYMLLILFTFFLSPQTFKMFLEDRGSNLIQLPLYVDILKLLHVEALSMRYIWFDLGASIIPVMFWSSSPRYFKWISAN